MTDDLISRQAAIDALDEIEAEVADGYGYQYAKWREYFVEMPPAQHEPHEGHWIPVHPIQSDDPGAYMCSKCKTGMWEIRPSAYHYCPHCGEICRPEENPQPPIQEADPKPIFISRESAFEDLASRNRIFDG